MGQSAAGGRIRSEEGGFARCLFFRYRQQQCDHVLMQALFLFGVGHFGRGMQAAVRLRVFGGRRVAAAMSMDASSSTSLEPRPFFCTLHEQRHGHDACIASDDISISLLSRFLAEDGGRIRARCPCPSSRSCEAAAASQYTVPWHPPPLRWTLRPLHPRSQSVCAAQLSRLPCSSVPLIEAIRVGAACLPACQRLALLANKDNGRDGAAAAA